ncbi:hypothetical protein [Lactococcus garvieae]|uniref:hypothetical protein n=1 Tax=Lactococcus garvieae TaxID=1363 RepID=UPI0022E86746|nr:hypothetical protein [Lactococcus garvieae]
MNLFEISFFFLIMFMIYMAAMLKDSKNKKKIGQKVKRYTSNEIESIEQRVKELEEGMFLLQHDITYDSHFEKVIYSTKPSHSLFDNSYQVEVQYLSLKEYNTANLIIKISLAGKVIKELETCQVSFEDVRSIYEFISHKIEEMENHNRDIIFSE